MKHATLSVKMTFLLVSLSSAACFPTKSKDQAKSKKPSGQNAEDVDEGFMPASGIPAPFLKFSNFTSYKDELSEDKLLDLLDEKLIFYNNYPESETSEENENEKDCMSKQYDSMRIKASKTEISFGMSVQVPTDCAESDFRPVSGNAKILYMITCTSMDFSKYDGKPVAEMDKTFPRFDDVCPSGKGTLFVNTSQNITYKTNLDDGKITEFKSSWTSAQMNSNNEGCEFEVKNGQRIYEDGCVSVETTTSKNNRDPEERRYFKAEFQRIKDKIGGRYVDSGVYAVVQNDWSGTVTANGASKEPTFKMTSASGTATGSIKYKTPSDGGMGLGFRFR